MPNLEKLKMLQKWVVMVYEGNRWPNSIQTIPQLRWYMFSKFQCDINNLLPTIATHIFHCCVTLLVLHRSLSTLQNLLSPLNYDWESSGELYLPILPALLALTQLSVHSCKTKCATNRCKCRKNALQCMDMCKCVDCKK